MDALTIERVEAYFAVRPYYYTDGQHFIANPSHRKARGLHYIGRFLNAKQAKIAYTEYLKILNRRRESL